MSTGLKANSDGSAAIQVGGTDVITLTSGGAATFVTSPTTVQAGTAAAPSITFSGDTNTGIYSPGADQVAIATGGTKRFEVDANGNAGLNITPSAWRDVDDVLQVGQGLFGGLATSSSTRRSYMGSNYYTNSSGQDIYVANGEASLYQQNNGAHAFLSATSGTAGNVATLTSILDVRLGKALALQGGAVDITGTGIAFPATQNASSNANTLDDYEEGTFTPTITYVTPGTLSVGYLTQLGRYTKVGRIVFIEITIRLNAFTKGTASGDLLIANLPFAFPASDPLSLFNIGFFQSSFSQFPVAIAFSGAAQMYLLASINNTGWTSQPDPDSNAQYFLSGSYTVA